MQKDTLACAVQFKLSDHKSACITEVGFGAVVSTELLQYTCHGNTGFRVHRWSCYY